MKCSKVASVFNRSGLAALSDIKNPEYQVIFSKLEKFQEDFLERDFEFRSKEYKWPRDPLHCWSRVWEYPYVYYHLSRYIKNFGRDIILTVADIGSGVTFFPFSLAQLGYEVICTDIDPICERDLMRATKVILHPPGRVSFRLIDKERLPFKDEECDALYCISVLEHIDKFEDTVREMARTLKPEGLCLITCDLGLDSARKERLNFSQYNRLFYVIEESFNFLWPERTKHPVDVLTSKNSPYANGHQSYARFIWQIIKQKMLKPLLGKKPGCIERLPPPLAIFGFALQKRR